MNAAMAGKPRSIDEYLETIGGEQRSVLEKLRKTIHSLIPGCEECISYSMPAFRYEGRVVAGFLATKAGCSYFPFSGTTLASLAKDISKYDKTKSALHFDPKHPLPETLVKKLLKARISEFPKQAKSRPATSAAAGSRRRPA